VAEPLFQAPKGTRDVLHPESARFRAFVDVFAAVVGAAGYRQVILPIMEHVEVFHRIGDATDIVQKEMFELDDRAGRRLALRPEQTASAVRAFVESRPPLPWKAWYAGPNFRAENVQKGRYRQFDQVGVEVLGVDDPYADVEVIALAWRFFEALGLRRLTLLLNSLGDAGDRDRYADALRDYFGARLDELSEVSRDTLRRNPLRVLDSKRRQDAPLIAAAPLLAEHLSPVAAAHFDAVQDGLRALGIPFSVEPRLVRGLDYYVRTTFEIQSSALSAAQSAIGGGGRYDGLVEQFGGPAVPGVGFALGLERTLLVCDAEGVFVSPDDAPAVFVIDTTGGLEACRLTDRLRGAGLSADLAVIIGPDELAAGEVTVRDLRGDEGQMRIPRHDLIDQLKKRLS
jgi:histidyl-tRNA synthetase